MLFEQTPIESNTYMCNSTIVRGGTLCNVNITYNYKNSITFSFAEEDEKIVEVEGQVTLYSIICDKDLIISLINIEYNQETNISTITFTKEAFYDITEDINCQFISRTYYKTQLTTFSAFNSRKYYNLYDVINDKVYPKTLLTFNLPREYNVIINVDIEPIFEKNGVEILDYSAYKMRSDGFLQWDSTNEFILMKGKKVFRILKEDYDGPYLKQENAYLYVEFIDTSWQDGYTNANGILIYNDYLFVTTNKALCVFDRYAPLQNPIFIDDTIKDGLDMTVDEHDRLYVLYPDRIRKYKIRHDLIYTGLVNSERKLYFREKDPRIYVNIE
jgi:hypothetical protein